MPPSHPRPADLTVLHDALTATGEHCATDSELLLDHMVTVGDHGAQSALETVVDDAVDALRELSATCRELALGLPGASAPGLTPTSAPTACTSESR